MALTYAQASEIVRGRLNLPTAAKLRTQKNIGNALQIFSERVAMDDNKRTMILTPRTVAGTPTGGVLDLGALVTSDRIMIDRLHQGRIYNVTPLTFTSADVSTLSESITIANAPLSENQQVRFTTSGVLPSPLTINTDYYIVNFDPDIGFFQLYSIEGDPSSLVALGTTGSGVSTLVPTFLGNEQPLQRLDNPDFTVFPVNFADSASDKYWWLIGNALYAFKGDGTPITTALQFNVPHTVSLAEFGTSIALSTLQDEFIDVLTELTAQGVAKRDAD